jgi:hypothetical protein
MTITNVALPTAALSMVWGDQATGLGGKANLPIIIGSGTNAVAPFSDIGIGSGAMVAIAPATDTNYVTAIGYNAAHTLTTADHVTAIGSWAAAALTDTTGSHNTCIGIDTMRFMTSGADNTAVGEECLNGTNGVLTASQCTSVGRNAMLSAGGTYNTALGYFAIASGTPSPLTGNYNTGIGCYSLGGLQGTDASNTALGMWSGHTVAGGSANTLLGAQAGYALVAASYNTIIGQQVGLSNPITGSQNILVGFSSSTNTATSSTTYSIGIGGGVVPGSRDIFIGTSAGAATNQDGNYNLGIGQSALTANTSGVKNTALGYLAGASITQGYNNLCLGSGSSQATLTTGHDNILIGTLGNIAEAAAAGSNFTLNLGNIIKATGLGVPATSTVTLAGGLTVAGAQLLGIAGTVGTPGIMVGTGGGLYSTGANKLNISVNGVKVADYGDTNVANWTFAGTAVLNGGWNVGGWFATNAAAAGGIGFGSGHFLKWGSSSTNTNFSADVGLYRNAAGVLEVNSGTAGAYRDLLARSIRGAAVAFASLPTAVEGMLVAVTDSTTTTWGATITGGGSSHVLAYYNGTNWTVAGK